MTTKMTTDIMTETKTETNSDNVAAISGSNGPIFDLIRMSRYRGGGLGNNGDGATATAHYVSKRRTIYLPYKYHSKYVPYTDVCKNCH